ncbi:MAG TPA: hypothetical protein VHO29_05975 [Marmoricola sp.]|nr:hypothetical protein [Marmoricola sp.]
MTALLLLAAVALSGCGGDETLAPPKPAGDSSSGRALSAQRTLSALAAALDHADAGAATALATSRARAAVAAMAANVKVLGLDDLSLRFVDDQSVLSASDRDQYGSGAWAGTAELAYRVSGWDTNPTRLETRFVFIHSGGRDLIDGVGGGDDRTPLWVAGPVTSRQAGRALVVAGAGQDPGRYLDLAQQALVDVGKVLPAWHGRLVIEVPSSEDELDHALDAPQEQYANIAAVTTTVDGSLVPGSPVHVFLNPRVFDRLGPRGAQVVVSHESTHVATNATFATLPTWLLEGFADYVALAHAGIPVETAASQILARIRRDGPPDHLPTADELDPTATGLGATYEEAWLAARFLAREYGEPRLVAFYQKVSDGEKVEDAFRTVLGTTEPAFVRQWRTDLRDLADGVAG